MECHSVGPDLTSSWRERAAFTRYFRSLPITYREDVRRLRSQALPPAILESLPCCADGIKERAYHCHPGVAAAL